MSTIVFSHVFFSYGTLPVLTNVSFTCGPADRLVVVGPNGIGKSTLLALAAGRLQPDSGTITGPTLSATQLVPPIHRPAATWSAPGVPLASRPPLAGDRESRTVAQLIDAATSGTRELAARFDFLTEHLAQDPSPRDEAEYDRVLAAMITRDAWTIDTRLEQTLEALDLGGLDRSRPLASLSPGQRARLRLALTLVDRPEALVLDEPTNHLDADGREHLARTIDDWQGPVLMTSHDRAFIERTATALLDLDPTPWRAVAISKGEPADFGAYRVRGSYSDYLRDKAAARSRHTAIHADQQAEKRRLVSHRRDSTVVGHARFKPRTETTDGAEVLRRPQPKPRRRGASTTTPRGCRFSRHTKSPSPAMTRVAFSFPRAMRTTTGGTSPHPHAMGIALAVRGASVEGRLAPTSFEVRYGEHLLVAGPNGSGKTTLLEWIARGAPSGAHGCIDAASGVVLVPQVLPRPGDPLIPEDAWHLGIGEAGKGFVPPAAWNRPLGELSAGNQRRAQLAFAARADAQILVIDEPTNYLDLNALESLEEAMREWEGTLVISTHDEWLISRWWGRLHRLDERR